MTLVIGSQSDVPNVGDPIISPWYQDTAKKIVHVFASTASRDAWLSPPDGAVCQAPAGVWFNRVAGAWIPWRGGNVRQGTVPSGTAPIGGVAAGVATITLPVGLHLVAYTVLLNSTAAVHVNLKVFVTGVFAFIYQVASVNETLRCVSFTIPLNVTGSGVVTVNVENQGTAAVDCFADTTSHAIAAIQSS